jgi:hypothetical protein
VGGLAHRSLATFAQSSFSSWVVAFVRMSFGIIRSPRYGRASRK